MSHVGPVPRPRSRSRVLNTLILFFKASIAFHEELVPVLEQLDVARSTLNDFDKRGFFVEKLSAKEGAAGPADDGGPAWTASFDVLRQLPQPLLVELIMQSMIKLPATNALLVAPDEPSPSSDASIKASVEEDPRKRPPAATASAAGPAPAAKRPRLSTTLSTSSKMVNRDAATAAARRTARKAPFVLTAAKVTEEERHEMTAMALRRILRAENRLTELNSSEAKRSFYVLISRMTSQLSRSKLMDVSCCLLHVSPPNFFSQQL